MKVFIDWDDDRRYVLMVDDMLHVGDFREQVATQFHALFPADPPLVFFRMRDADGYFLTDISLLKDVVEDRATVMCFRGDDELDARGPRPTCSISRLLKYCAPYALQDALAGDAEAMNRVVSLVFLDDCQEILHKLLDNIDDITFVQMFIQQGGLFALLRRVSRTASGQQTTLQLALEIWQGLARGRFRDQVVEILGEMDVFETLRQCGLDELSDHQVALPKLEPGRASEAGLSTVGKDIKSIRKGSTTPWSPSGNISRTPWSQREIGSRTPWSQQKIDTRTPWSPQNVDILRRMEECPEEAVASPDFFAAFFVSPEALNNMKPILLAAPRGASHLAAYWTRTPPPSGEVWENVIIDHDVEEVVLQSLLLQPKWLMRCLEIGAFSPAALQAMKEIISDTRNSDFVDRLPVKNLTCLLLQLASKVPRLLLPTMEVIGQLSIKDEYREFLLRETSFFDFLCSTLHDNAFCSPEDEDVMVSSTMRNAIVREVSKCLLHLSADVQIKSDARQNISIAETFNRTKDPMVRHYLTILLS